jgi:hypothetical protein
VHNLSIIRRIRSLPITGKVYFALLFGVLGYIVVSSIYNQTAPLKIIAMLGLFWLSFVLQFLSNLLIMSSLVCRLSLLTASIFLVVWLTIVLSNSATYALPMFAFFHLLCGLVLFLGAIFYKVLGTFRNR